jgi:hypothetical protein
MMFDAILPRKAGPDHAFARKSEGPTDLASDLACWPSTMIVRDRSLGKKVETFRGATMRFGRWSIRTRRSGIGLFALIAY